jgi:hypothetical protein
VPPDLTAAGPQNMTLKVWVGDGRLDSRLVVTIALDDPRIQRDELVRLESRTETGA